MDTHTINLERKSEGPMGDEGTQAYVNKMFADRRRDGLADPEPTTKEAAVFAPPIGVHGGKEHRKRNGGL